MRRRPRRRRDWCYASSKNADMLDKVVWKPYSVNLKFTVTAAKDALRIAGVYKLILTYSSMPTKDEARKAARATYKRTLHQADTLSAYSINRNVIIVHRG
jgi:hypothetical protein